MTSIEAQLVAILDETIPRYLRALRDAISDAEGPDRLTMQQLRCLQAIASSDKTGATTTKLADAMRVAVPTMSSMLDGLVTRGLVDRRPDPENRRRIPLFVTEQGLRLLDRYQQIMNDRHLEIVAALSMSEQETLRKSMMLMRDRLKAIEERSNEIAVVT
jgi:DNA-binding MarR family transcriptional regulator